MKNVWSLPFEFKVGGVCIYLQFNQITSTFTLLVHHIVNKGPTFNIKHSLHQIADNDITPCDASYTSLLMDNLRVESPNMIQ